MDEGLLPAWDQVHLEDLHRLVFREEEFRKESWNPNRVSPAQAETLLDVFGSADAASKYLPNIPEALIEQVMADARALQERGDEGWLIG